MSIGNSVILAVVLGSLVIPFRRVRKSVPSLWPKNGLGSVTDCERDDDDGGGNDGLSIELNNLPTHVNGYSMNA